MVLNRTLGLRGFAAIRREKYLERSSFSIELRSFRTDFMARWFERVLEAFHLRSACLRALLMDRTLSFIQGGGLSDKGVDLESLRGATESSDAVQRSINLEDRSSTEHAKFEVLRGLIYSAKLIQCLRGNGSKITWGSLGEGHGSRGNIEKYSRVVRNMHFYGLEIEWSDAKRND